MQSYADNGSVSGFFSSGESVSEEKSREFINTYWLPYFKNLKVYEPDEYPYSTSYPLKALNGSKFNLGFYTNYNHGRVYFLTSDNMGYYINFMDWDYKYDDNNNIVSTTAKYSTNQAIYVDINGIAEPNTLGKDVFNFVVDFSKNVVKTSGAESNDDELNNNCSKTGRGDFCAEKIIRDGWTINDSYPW